VSTAGIAALWVLALIFATVDGRQWTLHTRLTFDGAVLEVVGIALLASDPRRADTFAVIRSKSPDARPFAHGNPQRDSRTNSTTIALPPTTSHAHAGEIRLSGTGRLRTDPIEELRRELGELTSRVTNIETRRHRTSRRFVRTYGSSAPTFRTISLRRSRQARMSISSRV
jgi:hypothetical protein